jgi:hypothetical protein
LEEDSKNALSINFSAAQILKINDWIGKINFAHLHEESQPPGFEIVISFAGPFGQWADAVCGSEKIELGEVEIVPRPIGWRI